MKYITILAFLALTYPLYAITIPFQRLYNSRLFHFAHDDWATLEKMKVCRLCGKNKNTVEKRLTN